MMTTAALLRESTFEGIKIVENWCSCNGNAKGPTQVRTVPNAGGITKCLGDESPATDLPP